MLSTLIEVVWDSKLRTLDLLHAPDVPGVHTPGSCISDITNSLVQTRLDEFRGGDVEYQAK